MSLTQKAEQRLHAVGLVKYFEDDPEPWCKLARETYAFAVLRFPKGAVVRPDDVAGLLLPLVDVHVGLGDWLEAEKLKQRYWIAYFVDLILDRTWPTIKQQ